MLRFQYHARADHDEGRRSTGMTIDEYSILCTSQREILYKSGNTNVVIPSLDPDPESDFQPFWRFRNPDSDSVRIGIVTPLSNTHTHTPDQSRSKEDDAMARLGCAEWIHVLRIR